MFFSCYKSWWAASPDVLEEVLLLCIPSWRCFAEVAEPHPKSWWPHFLVLTPLLSSFPMMGKLFSFTRPKSPHLEKETCNIWDASHTHLGCQSHELPSFWWLLQQIATDFGGLKQQKCILSQLWKPGD